MEQGVSSSENKSCTEEPSLNVHLQSTPKCRSPSVSQLTINERLKETLEKHGIAKQNADSFLKGLLMDKDFKNLVKANLDEENEPSDTESTDVRITRSKLKEVYQNSPFKTPWPISPAKRSVGNVLPKFTEITLSENDDEDDEEYMPIESSFDSDILDQPSMLHPDTDKEDMTNLKYEVFSEGGLEENVLHVDELPGSISGKDDDIISHRTRSKHSLESTSINVLEAAFEPPDATADMYDTSIGDYDWHKWLTDLMTDVGGKVPEDAVEDEDDPVADPDFNFVPEMDEPDQEDLRNDISVRISKKELNSLLDEIDKMDDEDWKTVMRPHPSPLSIKDTYTSQLRVSSHRNTPAPRSNFCARSILNHTNVPVLKFLESQTVTLVQQLQQHVQLLAQTNTLCRNRADLSQYIEQSKEMLLELLDIGESQMQRLNIERSVTMPWNLQEAIEICGREIPVSEKCFRLIRMEKIKGHVPIPKAVAETMANSKVFMYRELLPMSAPVEPNFTYKPLFCKAEDNLVAIGIEQMSQFTVYSEHISNHILPAKTGKQILARIRNIMYCRHHRDTVNPIRRYMSCKILPKPCTEIKNVYQDTAQTPYSMKGLLPNWLLALQPLYEPSGVSPIIHGVHNSRESQQQKTSIVSSQPTNILVPYISMGQQSNIIISNSQPSPQTLAGDVTVSKTQTVTDLVPPAQETTQQARNPAVQLLPKPSVGDTMLTASHTITYATPTMISTAKVSLVKCVSTEPVSVVTSSTLSSTKSVEGNCVSTQQETAPISKIVVAEDAQNDIYVVDVTNDTHKGFVAEENNYLEPSTYFPLSSSSSENEELSKCFKVKAAYSHNHSNVTTAKTDDEMKCQPDSNDGCLSYPRSPPNHPISGMPMNEVEDKENKSMRVRFSKTEHGFRAQPIGGYLQKIHPKLSGRKGKPGSKDSRVLMSAAKSVKMLEEDTIVQLDPNRMDKENIFAAGYHKRVKETLSSHPETYEKFLNTLEKYGDGTRSPVDLYWEISKLFTHWPDLVQAFAPFLMPEQAHECGLAVEQELYGRARKFLRQIEIQFTDNNEHMDKILNIFHNVAETTIYREEDMMKSILNLLKDYPYLQDEFISFFESQYPPGINDDDDYEVVELTEEIARDQTMNQFEQVTILDSNDRTEPDEAFYKQAKKPRLSHPDNGDTGSSMPNKENAYLEATSADADDEGELFNTDYESEEEDMDDTQESGDEQPLHKDIYDQSSASLPPDITIISENALSSSPFKRITANAKLQEHKAILRPDTPDGFRSEATQHAINSNSFPTPAKSPSCNISMLPATPTGRLMRNKCDRAEKKSSESCINTNSEKVSSTWTLEMDEQILATCKMNGATHETFNLVADKIGRSYEEVEKRFTKLLTLLATVYTDDTTSMESEEDFETTESDASQC